MYRDDAIALDIKCDEIGGCLERDLAIVDQHRRTTVDDRRRKRPLLRRSVAGVIFADFGSPSFAKLCNKVERDIVGQHCTDRIEITRPEALDIGGESCPPRLRPPRTGTILSAPSKHPPH